MNSLNEVILIIDDDKETGEYLADFLTETGYVVKNAHSGQEGLEIIRSEIIDAVLTDIRMPGIGGITVLEEIKHISAELPVIMMTGYGSIEGAVESMKSGASSYLEKPINLAKLKQLLDDILVKKRLLRENLELKKQISEKYKFPNIISHSGSMEEVLDIAVRSAASKATVLIRGESGTGKELVAKAIHYSSPRNKKPLIVVNCGVLNENLIESNLFGHEKGSFTGAYIQHKGKFEYANTGTIFIDEVGDLPLSCQIKLLRVLEDGTFERIGGRETIHVDIRVIAATNGSLEDMLEKKLFREDLFYRLNVIPIFIPPLRKRREDIRALLDYYLDFYAKENNKEVKGFSWEALNYLLKYDYPGNVRELKNIIEQMVVLTKNSVISTGDLPGYILGKTYDQDILEGTFDEKVGRIETNLIIEALKESGYVQTKAAQLLGLTDRRFRYKLKNLNITLPD